MRTRTVRAILTALSLTTVLGVSACSSGGTTTTGASTSTSAPPTTATGSGSTAAPSGASTTTAAGRATTQVDANTASVAELQAAFEANGVTNAAKWAREVEEYRPYATDDPTFASLRKNLAKYNPAADVLQKILASLKL